MPFDESVSAKEAHPVFRLWVQFIEDSVVERSFSVLFACSHFESASLERLHDCPSIDSEFTGNLFCCEFLAVIEINALVDLLLRQFQGRCHGRFRFGY